MGSCIICGTSVDGRICDIHEEDVVFEFRGTSPEQLTPGRYYRGTVDGFAEFGVFVDIGERVTGLLHESELDRRLENLDWEPGETVFVQVKNVRDNGNVDLGWSIRQSDREFRGVLVDDPEYDTEKLPEEIDESPADETAQATETTEPTEPTEASDASEQLTVADADESDRVSTGSVRSREDAPDEERSEAVTESTEPSAETPATPRVTVDSLSEYVGDVVQIEARVVDARQTSGPTVFELRDGTGTVDCAAFKEAGVRAYPEVEVDDVVCLEGEVRMRRDELQIETEELDVLDGDDREAALDRMEEALQEKARPDALEPLVADPDVEARGDSILDVAGRIRRAIFEDRPIVVRHSATADGYAGAAAIERAALPLVREEHQQNDAEYHYFDRRPIEGDVYETEDATTDVTSMLDNRERHDEKLPLFVFVAAGGTRESLDGFGLLDIYDAQRIVIDTVAESAVTDVVDAVVSPEHSAEEMATATGTNQGPTATVLAATVAAHVKEDVRDDLLHLPAVSYWEDTPTTYADAAADAGYDAEAVRDVREAIALEAYYQSYEDKRELIEDLLFDGAAEDARGLASHVSEQFRTKLGNALETAEAHLERRTVEDADVLVLDTDAFTRRFEFPPVELLLDELYRRNRDDADALVGIGADELHVRSDAAIDVRDVGTQVNDRVADASVAARSARSQELEFLSGERDAVLDATVAVVAAAIE